MDEKRVFKGVPNAPWTGQIIEKPGDPSDPSKPRRYYIGDREIPVTDPAIVWWTVTRRSFRRLQKRWGPFDLEVGANERDHRLDRWIGPGGLVEDALGAEPWPEFTRIYSSPPIGWESLFVDRIMRELEASPHATGACILVQDHRIGSPKTGTSRDIELSNPITKEIRRFPYRILEIR